MTTTETILQLLPEIVLIGAATLIYLLGAFVGKNSSPTMLGLITFAVVFMILGNKETPAGLRESGPLAIDAFGQISRWFILLSGVLLLLLTRQPTEEHQRAEATGTLMMLIAGLMICARANDMVLLFLGLELVSIPTYVLLYIGRRGAKVQEATAKYFYLSILSSAVLLYGFSFLYGVSGSTDLKVLASKFSQLDAANVPIAGLGVLLVIAGLGFRLTAVPFHFYAPDVYQGVGHANAGLLSTMPKVAGLVVLIRVVAVSMPGMEHLAWKVLLAVSLLTMTLGNIVALWQRDLRRMFAYSSIAHGGYLLIGVAVGMVQQSLPAGVVSDVPLGPNGLGSAMFYVGVYTFATIGTFAVLLTLGGSSSGTDRGAETIDDLNGLSKTHPIAALAMAVFMFSLTGIPPLAGFWGKFNLLIGAIQVDRLSNQTQGWFLILAIVGVLNAAIGATYYLRVIARMYFYENKVVLGESRNSGPIFAGGICVVLVVVSGFFAGPMLGRTENASKSIRQVQSLNQSPSTDLRRLAVANESEK